MSDISYTDMLGSGATRNLLNDSEVESAIGSFIRGLQVAGKLEGSVPMMDEATNRMVIGRFRLNLNPIPGSEYLGIITLHNGEEAYGFRYIRDKNDFIGLLTNLLGEYPEAYFTPYDYDND